MRALDAFLRFAPTPSLDPDDPAVKAGTLVGRLLPACCCFVALVALVAVLVILLRRRKDRRARRPPPPWHR
jgi:hypothetical protein